MSAAPESSPKESPPTATERKWPWRWILSILAVLVLGGGLTYYFQPFTTKATIVTVETISSGPVTRLLAVNGRIAAMHSVDVRASISGTIAALPIAEGSSVRLGDVLARINPTSQDAILRQSRASLDAGRVAEDLANANYKRLAALKGVVTRSAIETAKSNAMSASEDVRRLVALFDQAEIELAKFTVLAPISGTIIVIDAEVGQLVDPGKPLVTIADLGQLIVETDVDEAYSTQIKDQMPAVLQLVGESKTRTGKVNFIAPNVNAATGGLAIKVGFDEPVAAPLGLTVTLNITVDQQTDALSVPRAAILTEAEVSSVFVMDGDIAKKRAVTLIDWPADRLIVTKGLIAGDVVIADATGLTDGQKVKTVTTANAVESTKTALPKTGAAP